MRKSIRVLFVGTAQSIQQVSWLFPANDFIVTPANSMDELASHLTTSRFDIVLAEANIDPISITHLVDTILQMTPQMPVIILDAKPTVNTAVEVIRHGASDYLAHDPTDYSQIPDRIKAALSKNNLLKQAENSGRILEIHAISQNSIDPFLAINQKGRVIEWNHPMVQLTGYPESQMIGQLLWEAISHLLPPEERSQTLMDQLRTQTQQFFSNELVGWERQGIEYKILRPDGTRRFIRLTVFPLRATSDLIAGCIMHDITDRKLAEEAFRLSEERYRMLVELVPDGIIVFSDAIIIFANKKAVELAHAASLDDLVGKSIFAFVHPDSRQFVNQQLKLSADEIPLAPAEEKFIRLDGSVFDAEVQTRPVLYQGKPANLVILRNITERKQAEEKLRQSEYRLIEAQRLARFGSFEMTANLETSYWSDELFTIFNRDPADGLMSFFAFLRRVIPEDRAILSTFFKQISLKGDPFNCQFRFVIDGGEVKHLHAIGQPVLDGLGRIIKVFGTIADITQQKLIEQALRSSEARYHGLFENSPIIISEQDFSEVKKRLDSLRAEGVTDLRGYLKAQPHVLHECISLLKMIDINQAGLALYKAEEKQAIFANLNQLIKEDSLQLFAEELIQIFDGKNQFALEGVNYTLSGEPRQVRLRWIASTGYESTLSNVIVTITDITDRKRMMDELVRSEERFRNIVEQSLDGIVITDHAGVIQEWNRGMEKMSGLARVEVIGKFGWEIQFQQMVPESRDKTSLEQEKKMVQEYLSHSDASWFGKVIEHPILQPNGVRRIIQSIYFPIQTGQEQMVVNISRDVTDYQEARRNLDQTQERFRLLAENISDLVVMFEPNGIITYASPSFRMTLQYEPDALIGTNVFSMIHPEDIEMVRTIYYPRLLNGEEMERVEYRARRNDNTYIWLETGAQPIYAGNGEVIQVVASSRDVTERKKTEHELQSAQIQLAHRIAELEMRTQELNLLTEMTNMLQICSDPTEAISVIAQYCNDLFPGVSGVLFVESNDANLMQGGAFWGKYSGEREINRKDCWGLRRGRIHMAQDTQKSLSCRHTGVPQPSSSICIPVMSSGQAIGLLSLQTAQNLPFLTTAQQKLAAATAEQIGLALSNLNLRQNLREMATRDSLTGLYNRHFLEETLESEVSRAQRNGKPIGIIMLDLDNFKELNSIYGHPNVDQMLRDFGAMLKRSIRSGDIACRYGGDEFLLILPETTLAIAEQRAEQIRLLVKNLRIQGEDLEPRNASASIGVACWPQHGNTSLRLLNTVDLVMLKAKQAGGDRVKVAE